MQWNLGVCKSRYTKLKNSEVCLLLVSMFILVSSKLRRFARVCREEGIKRERQTKVRAALAGLGVPGPATRSCWKNKQHPATPAHVRVTPAACCACVSGAQNMPIVSIVQSSPFGTLTQYFIWPSSWWRWVVVCHWRCLCMPLPWLTHFWLLKMFNLSYLCRTICGMYVIYAPPTAKKGPSSVLPVPGDRGAVELGEPAVPALQRAPHQHAGRPRPLLRSALAFRPKHAGMYFMYRSCLCIERTVLRNHIGSCGGLCP